MRRRGTYGAGQGAASLLPHEASPSQPAGSLTHYGTSAWRSGGVSATRRAEGGRAHRKHRLPTERHVWRRRICYLGGGRRARRGHWWTADLLPPKSGQADRSTTRNGRAAAWTRAQRDCQAASGAAYRSRWPCCHGVVGTAWLWMGAIVIVHRETQGTLERWATLAKPLQVRAAVAVTGRA